MLLYFIFKIYLTLGSNFKDDAVSNAARPSFRIIPKPPTKGEYSISTIKVFLLVSGAAITLKHKLS